MKISNIISNFNTKFFSFFLIFLALGTTAISCGSDDDAADDAAEEIAQEETTEEEITEEETTEEETTEEETTEEETTEEETTEEETTEEETTEEETTEEGTTEGETSEEGTTEEETTEEETEEENNDDTDSGLNPNLPPSSNFDLSTWNIGIPVDTDGNNKSDTVSENDLNNGYEDSDYFYTGDDGGMVFVCKIKGPKTSEKTKYTRTEFREMLRAGNTSIGTQGVNKNNWVFGSAPSSDISKAAGYNGLLTATLAVNHVTTTGDSGQVGRVIVGQIHANDDEPVRIYYRKLPNNELGGVYIAHEGNNTGEDYYNIIGDRSNSASNPSDGIALNEKFGYEIKVTGNDLWVTITREGKQDVVKYVDMTNSKYDVGGQYMYFKAGVYNQNNTGDDDDYVKATFYKLENSHTN